MPRTRRAGGDAGRHALLFGEVLVVDAVDAQGAFAHHALVFVELARAIRAGPGAQLAADADIGVDQDDAVFRALVAGAGGTDGDAGRVLAVQAGAGEVDGAAVGAGAGFVGVHAVQPDAVGVVLVGAEIGQRRGMAGGVPLLAVHRAGVAADAGVEVDDEAELFRAGGGDGGHAHASSRHARSEAGTQDAGPPLSRG